MHIRKYSLYLSAFAVISIAFFSGCREDDPKVVFELPSNIIHKIAIDKNGTKWIATEKGLVSFDGEKWNPYPDIPFENSKSIADLNFGTAESGKKWIGGTQGVHFLKFNPADILSFGSYAGSENELLSDEVTAIALDDLNIKYFGTSLGLSILDNETWTSFYGRNLEPILRDYPISAIATAKNGWIYAATYGGGVSRFKYTDAVSGATTYDEDWSGLKSNYINTVIVVDDTCQWYGTNLGAAYHTSHVTKTPAYWKQYTKEDGLISDTVYSIAKDHNGNIWFGTEMGVSRLTDNVFKSYTTSDGLTSNKVNTISIDIDGSIWFGTNNGISHFENNSWTNYTIK